MGFYQWRLMISLAAARESLDPSRMVRRSRQPRVRLRWALMLRGLSERHAATTIVPMLCGPPPSTRPQIPSWSERQV